MLENGLLGRGPKTGAEGLFADCGLLCCGGDSMKHSPNDIDVDVDNLLLPAPNLNGGN